MIMLTGYDDKKQEFSLLNTNVSLDKAVKKCPYAYKDMLFASTDGVKIEESLELKRQLRRLRRLGQEQAEYKILYYSCDFDTETQSLRNIMVHLVDGRIVTLEQLKDETLIFTERNQIDRLMQDIKYNEHSEWVYLLPHLIYILSQGEVIRKDSCAIHSGINSNEYVYVFLVRGTNAVLPIVSYKVSTGYHFAIGLQSIEVNIEKGLINYIPKSIREDGSYDVYGWSYIPETRNSFVSEYIMSKELLETRIYDVGKLKSLLDYQSSDITAKAFNSFMYLVHSGLVDPYKVTLLNGFLDMGELLEEAQQIVATVMDSTQLFGSTEAPIIVKDKVLKAIVPTNATNAITSSVTVDLAGIEVIEPFVLEGFSRVNLVCNGEYCLRKVGKHSAQIEHFITSNDKQLLNAVKSLLWGGFTPR